MSNTDLYDILGVAKDATDEDIKRAYRKLAVKYHPDKNKSADAEEMFKKISAANDVLSDPEKRRTYDAYGMEGLQGGAGASPFGNFAEMFFGANQRGQMRTPVAQMAHPISLSDYFTKTTVSVEIPTENPCTDCDATGFVDKRKHQCKKCQGTGVTVQIVRQGPVTQQIRTHCPVCRGLKIDTKYPTCDTCEGKGSNRTATEVEVKVPNNICSGNAHTVLPKRGPIMDGNNIDLAVVFKLQMEKDWGLASGQKLVYTVHINLAQTVCGFKKIMEHPSGRSILIQSDPGNVVTSDYIYVLPGLGFDGDQLYVIFVVHYPEYLQMPETETTLTYASLEAALCGDCVEAITEDIPIENVFNLGTVKKINNNPKTRESEAVDSDSDEEFNGAGQVPGCTQQ